MQAAAGNAEVAAFEGGDLREAHQAELAGTVGRGVGPHPLCRDRADVDDSAAALTFHDPHCLAGAQERTAQIDGDYAIPGFRGQLLDRAALEGPGVVDED